MTSRRFSRSTLTLLVVLFGYLTLPMGMTGTSVALPDIGRDLDASGAALQWVVTGYVLAATSVMLVTGSLGDLFGRRRVYATGLGIYAVGTLAGAGAQDILLLDIARTFAGIGAAGVMTTGVAILAGMHEGPARARVFATVGTTAGFGIAIGPTLSGWLVGAFGWRASFLLFGGAAVLILLLTRLMPAARPEGRPKVDRPGVATFVAGLALLMFAVTRGGESGWGSAQVLVPLLLGIGLLALFVRVERRSDHPVLDLSLIRNRTFRGWLTGATFVVLGSTGVTVFLPTYLQGTGDRSASATGVIMLLLTVPVFVLPSVAGRLVTSYGVPARRLLLTSLLLSAAGNLWLASVLAPDAGAARLAVPLLLIGVANGLGLGQIDAQALSAVAPERVGMASGLLSTARGGAGALALAGFGAALLTLVESRVGDPGLADRVASGRTAEVAGEFTDAWQILVGTVGVTLALAAVVVHRLLRPRPEPLADPVADPEPEPVGAPGRAA
ncbi:MFS transporter [Streptomyces sp. NPDC000594]|uniref:MFS transporter n=1 Tax=Streptomyces sp. NPDC000594 TaxID=3154261 RepID=UPI003317D523